MPAALPASHRSTIDVDLVVELESHQVDALADRLSVRFYVPVGLIRRAVQERSSANVIDTLTSVKVDLFMAGGTPLDRDGLDWKRGDGVSRLRAPALRAVT